MIKVALGTEKFSFHRVLEWIDRAIDDGLISSEEEIIVQSGSTKYTSKHGNMTLIPTIPYGEQMENFKKAQMCIIHAGIGNFLDFADLHKMPIIIPRDPKLGEHLDNHQMDFTEVAKQELGLLVAFTYEEFADAIKNYKSEQVLPTFKPQLVEYLVSVVEG